MVNDVLISKNTSIINAIKAINTGKIQIVFVVDNDGRLIGSITDGDIRRGILSGFALSDEVNLIMNEKPISVRNGIDQKHLTELMNKNDVFQIPVVDNQGKVIDVASKQHLLCDDKIHENAVVLMAGGLGTRLRPLTIDIPKPMIKIGGKHLLETIIENFKNQNFRKFYLSVNFMSNVIKDYFCNGENLGVQINYIEEEKPLGTAGSLSLIKEKFNSPLIVMNGDVLTNVNFTELLNFHEQSDSVATICVREYVSEIPYGVVKTNGSSFINIEEKPKKNVLVNTGIYVLSPDLLSLIPKNKDYDMPTLISSLKEDGHKISVFPIHEYWLDIGRIDDLEKAQLEYKNIFMN